MSSSRFTLEDIRIREAVRDLHVIKPHVYWMDFLIAVTAGWIAVLVAATLPLFSAGMLVALGIAVLSLYRALCFIHEISHQTSRTLPGFEKAWNLLVGYPLLMPSCVYSGVHQFHHSLKTYGTSRDPEYMPFARSKVMTVLFAVESFLIPVALLIRFLLLSVAGFASPPLQKWLVVCFSSLTMNLTWRREAGPQTVALVRRQSAHILLIWAGFAGLALAGWLPWHFFIVWLMTSSAVSFVNTLRTLGAHAYDSTGEPLDREAQLVDSIDTPGAVWTELWAPVGLRYHALHHYFPGLPYHNLPEAWRRITLVVPANAVYHESRSRGLAFSLLALISGSIRQSTIRQSTIRQSTIRQSTIRQSTTADDLNPSSHACPEQP